VQTFSIIPNFYIFKGFGLKTLDNVNRHVFIEIIEDRHGKRSTIIASQLPTEAWHQIIGEQTIADAILDRLVHSAKLKKNH